MRDEIYDLSATILANMFSVSWKTFPGALRADEASTATNEQPLKNMLKKFYKNCNAHSKAAPIRVTFFVLYCMRHPPLYH